MKQITIYECNDGSRFYEKEKAVKYDALCEKINNVLEPLGERTEECEKGGGFIPHDPVIVKKVFKDFMQICADETDDDFLRRVCLECGKGTRDKSHALCDLLDSGIRILENTASRFYDINFGSGREYSCLFYAKHEPEFLLK